VINFAQGDGGVHHLHRLTLIENHGMNEWMADLTS
jgi:hypothetical protein